MTELNWNQLSPEEAYSRAALQLALYKVVAEEIPPVEESESDPEMDKRMLRLIHDQFRQIQSQKVWKEITVRILKTAVIAVLILNLFLTTGFALSLDFRKMIMKLFVTVEPTHSELIMQETPEIPETSPVMPSEYGFEWLPDDSFEIVDYVTGSFCSSITYQADHDVTLTLEVYTAECMTNIDTEGMSRTTMKMADKELQVFHQDQHYVMVWHDKDAYFVVQTWNMREAEAITAALSVQPKEARSE